MWYWLFYSANNYSRPHKIQTLFLFNISTANKEVLPSNKGHPFTLVYTWYPLSLGTWSTWHLGTLGTESHLALSHLALSHLALCPLCTWSTWHSITFGTWSQLALGHPWHSVNLALSQKIRWFHILKVMLKFESTKNKSLSLISVKVRIMCLPAQTPMIGCDLIMIESSFGKNSKF